MQNGRNVGMAQLAKAGCLSWVGLQKLPAHDKPRHILHGRQNGRNVGMAQLAKAGWLSWVGLQKLPAHEKPRHIFASPSKRPKRRDGAAGYSGVPELGGSPKATGA